MDAFVGNRNGNPPVPMQVLSGTEQQRLHRRATTGSRYNPTRPTGCFRIIPSGTATTDIIVYDGTGQW